MSEEQQGATGVVAFPDDWQITDYDPSDHMMSLKGKDYLNVQNRLKWFLRDQRRFIALQLAKFPYQITTDLVELDRERGFAHFRTFVRDVLGNEATMYGSETAKDFGDYVEKASTKSVGRALAMLGYGTENAGDDEGKANRPVDSPVNRNQAQRVPQSQQRSAPQQQQSQSAPANVTPLRPAQAALQQQQQPAEPTVPQTPQAQIAAGIQAIHEHNEAVAARDEQRELANALLEHFGRDDTKEYTELRRWLGEQMGLGGPVGKAVPQMLYAGEHATITHKQVVDITANLGARRREQAVGAER